LRPTLLRQNNPTGKIPLNLSGKTPLHLRVSRLTQGALAIVVNVGAGCGGRGSVGHELKSQGGLPVSDHSMQTNGAEA